MTTPIERYSYNLPKNFIAQRPLEKRDESKLMLLDRKKESIEHHIFRDLPHLIDGEYVIIGNDSKVIPAKIYMEKETGGTYEILFVENLSDNKCHILTKPNRRLKEGTKLYLSGNKTHYIELIKRHESGIGWEANFQEFPFPKLLECGLPPLPPYIKEKLDDAQRYQTVYAKKDGSIAGPTAGFHFTEEIISTLKRKKVDMKFITLHISLHTFLPLKSGYVEENRVYPEYVSISEEVANFINESKRAKKKILAIGTSTVRALESAFRNGIVHPLNSKTELFITEGFKFRVVDCLLTNFHLPKSTNLILVSSFAGRSFILKAYQTAIKMNYRFYSFGDCMLII